jgi:hypothetical protein
MTSPSGTSTESPIGARLRTGRRLAMIWSVASPRLIERLDQLAGAVQVGHELLGRIPRGPHELLELRAAQPGLGFQFGLEHFGASGETGRHRQADADRVIHFVGDAGDEAA